MATPGRSVGGLSTDNPAQGLADFGLPNPFLYHYWEDDFDDFKASANTYVVTVTSSGTIANVAGDGGQILFTTNPSIPLTTDIASVELPQASYCILPGKRSFFKTRLALMDITNPAFEAGLTQSTTTPFSVTDGVYFSKASGSTALNLNVTVASSNTQTLIPTNANAFISSTCSFTGSLSSTALGNGYTLTITAISAGTPQIGQLVLGGSTTPGTMIIGYGTASAASPLGTYIVNISQTKTPTTTASFVDLEWEYNPRSSADAPYGSFNVFVGVPDGYINTGNNGAIPNGFCVRYIPTSFAKIPVNLLTPTIALQSGTATSKVMYCDLLFAARER